MEGYNKYNDGKIYCLKAKRDDGIFYIGSSCDDLNKRFKYHRYDKRKVYRYCIDELRGIDNFYIELICYYPCDSKQELHKKKVSLY